ncbi:MAG: tRNA pseudouridine(55) synthase TruB [Deltaproteobacteria bacterium]|nr:MAG: tRNA pseudouridine(55) synthase TruB [Deltaproteobacteria bacterium]
MARKRGRSGVGPHGVVVVDKPVGPTSFKVLRAVERQTGAGRAGHAGTLDPAATGILLVLLGEATKLSHWVMVHDKAYRATIALGTATDSLDATGEVVEVADVPAEARDPERVRAALAPMVGEVWQVPPVYSALKRGGRTLMSRARAGEDVEVEPRRVVCHGLELVAIEGDQLVVDVACGSGYYVRSLARDLGAALGVPAHLAALRRTRLGAFDITEAVPLAEVGPESVRPLVDAAPELPKVVLSPSAADDVRHGRPIAAEVPGPRAILLEPEGAPLALVERTADDRWRVFRGFRFEDPKSGKTSG